MELKGIGNLLTQYDMIGIEDSAYMGMVLELITVFTGGLLLSPQLLIIQIIISLSLSSSKIFSYTGQRIAVTVISPKLMDRKFSGLYRYFNTENLGHAFIHGGVYTITASIPQTPQYALTALFKAAKK